MSISSLSTEFLKFNNNSPTPFHCVSTARKLLESVGFKRLSLKDNIPKWNLQKNGLYYFTRNQSSLIAFAMGGYYKPQNGMTIIAAHTDSPSLLLKPISKSCKSGFLTLGLETYGGGYFNSWFDRDLSIAGRAIVRKQTGGFDVKLFKIKRPILSIPRLAIHLTTRDESLKGYKINFEKHLNAIIGLSKNSEKTEKSDNEKILKTTDLHHSELNNLIAKELNVKPENICSTKTFLYDTQPASIGGINKEFIYAPKLDNQMMSFVALKSLIESSTGPNSTLNDEKGVRMISLFDNEEIGSKSDRGADSRFLFSTLQRIIGNELINQCIERSILISADMAHAVHPNYEEKHSQNHRIGIGKGLAIKFDSKEKYSTTDITSFFLQEVAKKKNIPIQLFVNKQDSRSGSTVGPYLSSNCGIRTIDVGIPQLAMHSVREMCGIKDMESSMKLFTSFFEEFHSLDNQINVY